MFFKKMTDTPKFSQGDKVVFSAYGAYCNNFHLFGIVRPNMTKSGKPRFNLVKTTREEIYNDPITTKYLLTPNWENVKDKIYYLSKNNKLCGTSKDFYSYYYDEHYDPKCQYINVYDFP
jgi:hypothetical protein